MALESSFQDAISILLARVCGQSNGLKTRVAGTVLTPHAPHELVPVCIWHTDIGLILAVIKLASVPCRGAYPAAVRGKRSEKVVIPLDDSTSSVPPCDTAISRLMYRPNPRCPLSRLLSAWARAKALKTVLRSFGGIHAPSF